MFPAQGQEAVIHVYRSELVGREGTNVIRFDLYSEVQQDFTQKFFAYAAPEIGAQLHRHHIYRVRFNDDPKYPRIEAVLGETAI